MKTLTVEEAAAVLKVHRTTVLELLDSGEIDGAKFGSNWCIPEPKLDAYILKTVEAQTAERRARAAETRDEERSRSRNRSELSRGAPRSGRRPYPALAEVPQPSDTSAP